MSTKATYVTAAEFWWTEGWHMVAVGGAPWIGCQIRYGMALGTRSTGGGVRRCSCSCNRGVQGCTGSCAAMVGGRTSDGGDLGLAGGRRSRRSVAMVAQTLCDLDVTTIPKLLRTI